MAGAVKTLNCENLPGAKLDDLARCGVQVECLHHPGTEPLVFDGVLHVHLHVAHQAERQFEDVRGRRRTERATPFPAMEQQGGLLLRARQGNPEFIGLRLPEDAAPGQARRDHTARPPRR